MKWSENFATAALISFTFASTNEGNSENIGAVRRNRDFSLSRLSRVIASDSASSFRFIFLAFTDVRLKLVEADNDSGQISGIYMPTSRSQESRITCMTLTYGSTKALGRTPNLLDSDVSMLIKKCCNNVTYSCAFHFLRVRRYLSTKLSCRMQLGKKQQSIKGQ